MSYYNTVPVMRIVGGLTGTGRQVWKTGREWDEYNGYPDRTDLLDENEKVLVGEIVPTFEQFLSDKGRDDLVGFAKQTKPPRPSLHSRLKMGADGKVRGPGMKGY
jgi:hypothetical protein